MRRAFTLIELLVVVSIIALLIAILLPVLGAARDSAKAIQCGSNLKQLGIAQFAYTSDNRGQFTAARHWVMSAFGQGFNPRDPTILDGVLQGTLFPYVNDVTDIYLCPVAADRLTPDTFVPGWQNQDRVARNYVQNWNVGPFIEDPDPGWPREELTIESTKRPSDLVVFSEENTFVVSGLSTRTLNDGYLLGRQAVTGTPNIDCFATFHNSKNDITAGDANAVFADGHVEFVNASEPAWFSWQNPETGVNETISATVMWCTDAIPVQR
ncbi:MAG: prepilin-type N-terminal cleavage/methylation domain-containing protein [Planctomycetota bacterium]